ncbi:ATP-dependent RNA helicase ROK1, putative [Plasmodium berghei]|uniref:RNA helicase n=2 Tax=Plasmodium berghei TaxID=5821 RepID=A0A509AEN5_PLABA|nr:ATP-dependent RNA helicase ROK1, putative [Plasmodium berghei ANKA]SCL92680.1 ATP-dependent RNA helicase ROK1, putative [Plasmodium berghei]SCM15693.1 ATP-dependent RNA helicase ROK1, putative [Plasmodium berghei]SCN22871.1 ATP-dependent RNA helicase ROK1, putative [Plasmodium berghei]VUC54469.1 ATP-dependent RNA helicase ROK1, putative [Plasmodium berghei ANKA]|eukprot:XP_034420298.1 ATP-dependent RNA helicase ROK1, putative [Plasmodium berghei ANKA]
MDVIKKLTYGLNLKNNDLMSLKEENLKPLKNIININTASVLNINNSKKKGIIKDCESINFSKFKKNEKLVNKYMKENDINIEYFNLNRVVIPIRFFNDIADCIESTNYDNNKLFQNVDKSDNSSCPKVNKENICDNIISENDESLLKVEMNNINENIEIRNKKIKSEEIKKLMNTIKNTLYFEYPTSIQKICIPSILNGFNTICISQTGSGKTCAFLIPLLLKLISYDNVNNNDDNNDKSHDLVYFRSLVIVPTVELAIQIYEHAIILFESFRKFNIINLQNKEIEINKNVDVCICTPLVLLQLLEKEKKISLQKCFYIVFDEVDKLFEIKFLEHVNCLLNKIKNIKIQKIFTTATLPGKVKSFINTLCVNYTIVYFGKNINTINNNIKQELIYINSEDDKFIVLNNLIKNKEIHIPVLIFTDSIEKCKYVYKNLIKSMTSINTNNINYTSYIETLTSDKSKEERNKIFQKLKSGNIWYLICTDVMSRGIDINGIETVINYDVCYDKYNYIHRIGRVCRSDNKKEGKAITFFTKNNIKYMNDIIRFVKNSGTQIPEYLENFRFAPTPKFNNFAMAHQKGKGKNKEKLDKKKKKISRKISKKKKEKKKTQ